MRNLSAEVEPYFHSFGRALELKAVFLRAQVVHSTQTRRVLRLNHSGVCEHV